MSIEGDDWVMRGGRVSGEPATWQVNVTPREEALVREALHDLLLKPSERAVALAVEGWHVDIEHTE